MRREKYLTAALCCCGLALCVAVGIALHFQQESRERQELLTEARERQELLTEAREQIELMEVELAQAGEQLTLAEEARADAEKERDYAQRQYEWATERDNPIDRYYDSDKRPMVISFSFFKHNSISEISAEGSTIAASSPDITK